MMLYCGSKGAVKQGMPVILIIPILQALIPRQLQDPQFQIHRLANPWSVTDSTATGAERASAAAGLGRLGLVGMDQIFGGGADAAMLNQVMQNPTLSQMMQTLLSKSHMYESGINIT
ncbi:hypothetical protein SAY86_010152 [Trapa natans]|uniref:Uncharacterized protein n=1 Tax=Trapa natans TaxID=22666 RepID=A0AAN7QQV3_TRANT|nr:hypothetical protein SAY86_010152 [Trapa natans]